MLALWPSRQARLLLWTSILNGFVMFCVYQGPVVIAGITADCCIHS